MYAVRGVVSGSITIGMGEHVLTDPLCALPESLAELKRRAPNVHPEILVMTHAQLNQALRERRVQIGIRGQYKKDRAVHDQPLFVDNHKFYVSDRKSVVFGKIVSVSVELGGRGAIYKQNNNST